MYLYMENTLTCRYCNEIKTLTPSNFKVEKRTKLGFDSVCKSCRKEETRLRRISNIDQVRKKEAEYRKSDKYKEYQKKYWDVNKNVLNDKAAQRYQSNKQPYLERSKKQRESNPEKYKQYQIEYRTKNKTKLNQYIVNKLHTDINFKLKHTLRSKLRKLVLNENKTNSALLYLGCTVDFFRGYLEAKFKDGMSWANYGELWHIDHILPCRSFNMTLEEDRRKCFHYSNMQPLLAIDNLQKLDKLPDGTFARDKLK